MSDPAVAVSRVTTVTVDSQKFVATMCQPGRLILATKLPMLRISHVNAQEKRDMSIDDARDLAAFLLEAARVHDAEYGQNPEKKK
jgi:hypothetical protein